MPTQKNPQNRVEAAQPTEHSVTEHSATEHSAIDSTHRVVNVCAVAIRNRTGSYSLYASRVATGS